jgi:[protein-PII] uridylyltransferase
MVDRAAQRRARAEEADALLFLLLSKACVALGVPTEGVALVAIGG